MSTAEFIARQNKILDGITKSNKPLLLAVKSVMAAQSNRVFVQGLNSSNAPIGTYSDNEIYVNPKNSPKKFAPIGKHGDKKFKDGRPHETGYFENYLAYKKKIGRNKKKNTVDLILTGELSKDWANAEVLSKANATRISAHHYIVGLKEHNADKVERYGAVFETTKEERDLFIKVIQHELGNTMRDDKNVN